MKAAIFVALLMLMCFGQSLAECTQPPLESGQQVYTLKDVKTDQPDGMILVGLASPSGGVVSTRVSKDSHFVLERTNADAFWEYYSVRYYCDGDEWVGVSGTTLKLQRRAKQPEPVQLPKIRQVKAGESWGVLAREAGVSVEMLKTWNQVERDVVYNTEHVFVSDPGAEQVRRWNFALGDPSGLNYLEKAYVDSLKSEYGDPLPGRVILRHHIMLMDVPEPVRQDWISIVEASIPDTVWMFSSEAEPQILNALVFGGLKSDEVKVWGKTACFWKDARTLEPIDSLLTAEYPWVDHESQRYFLYQFLDCQNGAYISIPLEYEGVTEVEERAVVTPPAAVIPKTEPPKVGKPADWVENGTVWLTYERVQPENANHQNNLFSGVEWVVRPGYTRSGIGLVMRTTQDLLNKDYAGEYRLGLRFKIYSQAHAWFVLPEAGGWYGARQMTYRTYTHDDPDWIEWEDHARFFDGYGWYGRLIGVAPQFSYMDIVYRQGNNLSSEFKGELTTEPNSLYAKASYGKTRTPELSRGADGETITFPLSEMETREGRLGLKPWSNLVLYGSWSDWRFDSPIWSFDWWGPGAGAEWRINGHWRTTIDVKRFNHALNRDLKLGEVYDDPQWRVTAGVNYGW